MAKRLTPRQQVFVKAFVGNATEAAKAAGCSDKTAANTGARWMRNAQVRDAIRRREEQRLKGTIAKRVERQEFWTTSMRNAKAKLEARLRASELLGKSEADFTERHEVKGELTLLDLVRESMGHGVKPLSPLPAETPVEPVSDRASTPPTEESPT